MLHQELIRLIVSTYQYINHVLASNDRLSMNLIDKFEKFPVLLD